jgi:hypothetical protein
MLKFPWKVFKNYNMCSDGTILRDTKINEMKQKQLL